MGSAKRTSMSSEIGFSEHAGLPDRDRLPTAAVFKELLGVSLGRAQRIDRHLAVLFLRLGGTDLGGEGRAQRLSEQVERCVKKHLRTGDFAGVFAEDAFAICFPDLLTPGDAQKATERMLHALAPILEGEDRPESFAASIALFPNDGVGADEILMAARRSADELCGSLNGYAFLSQNIESQLADRLVLEENLERAIEEQQVLLHFQPQVEMGSRRIVGVEALAHWRHPDLGIVTPSRFIPIAEDTGLILKLGDYVIRHALGQVAQWEKAGLAPVSVAVNLSTREFLDRRLAMNLNTALKDFDFDPSRLTLEFSENGIMRNADIASQILPEIEGLGVKVSLDEFGTGYASLICLQYFPIHQVKIDRAFVSGSIGGRMTGAGGDWRMIDAITGLAAALDLETVAMGIETEEQFAYCQGKGCTFGQGRLFSRPLGADDLAAMLDKA